MSDIVERLNKTALYESWGEQSDLPEEAAGEIATLRAENEKLREMVRKAYNEGFGQGMREHTSSRGGIPWHDSKLRAALEGGEA